jgi:hypothetical protein
MGDPFDGVEKGLLRIREVARDYHRKSFPFSDAPIEYVYRIGMREPSAAEASIL